jgi:glycerate-2-kinase
MIRSVTLEAVVADPRRALERWFGAGLAAVDPERLLPRFAALESGGWVFRRGSRAISIDMPDRAAGGRLRIIAIGKAAASMARGFAASLRGTGQVIDAGLVITKDRTASSGDAPWQEILGDHPHPGERSVAAAQALLDFIGRPIAADRFVVLLSGGASALCALPIAGITLEEKRRLVHELMASGASIVEINRLRSNLSALKGGKLARRISPAKLVTLAISDVPGDDLALIGSGPSFDPPRAPGVVIATLDDALEAIAETASAEGVAVRRLGRVLYGWLDDEVVRLRQAIQSASPQAAPRLWVAGGEPRLMVRGSGRGGRAQEFALRLARSFSSGPERGLPRTIHGLIAGTDGSDGPTDAAGGFFDNRSLARLAAAGVDLDGVLTDNDSYPVLAAVGDRFVTGPTGTNVADVALLLEMSG